MPSEMKSATKQSCYPVLGLIRCFIFSSIGPLSLSLEKGFKKFERIMTRLFINSETLMLSMLQRFGDTWSGLNENIKNKIKI